MPGRKRIIEKQRQPEFIRTASWLLGGKPELMTLFEQFPFFIIRSSFTEPIHDHTHEFFEIDIITGGRGFNRIGDNQCAVTARDVCIGNFSEAHAIIPDRRIDTMSIKFRPSVLSTISPDSRSPSLLMPFAANTPQFRISVPLEKADREAVFRLAHMLEAEYAARRGFWQEAVSSILGTMLLIIYRSFAVFSEANHISHSGKEHQLVDGILRYIERNFSGNIRITALLKEFNISATRALVIFKRVTGTSLKEYLTERCVLEAKRLLATTDDAVIDVCHASGFIDLSNFNRVFRQRTGCSPREYRDAQRR
ncbi:MAG: AraC family transcriptional regulator [Spirochaetes bacterium]|nr:AraC family transcriptional regulator [Spirochaetota bacterium]